MISKPLFDIEFEVDEIKYSAQVIATNDNPVILQAMLFHPSLPFDVVQVKGGDQLSNLIIQYPLTETKAACAVRDAIEEKCIELEFDYHKPLS